MQLDWRMMTMSKERLEEIEKNLDPLGYGMGGHLISVNDIYWLVKYSREQAERVEELEETVEDYKTVNKELHQRGRKVRKQNKRYREALELLVKQETLGKDAKTGKTAVSYNGMIALKGLGIFNDDVYTVYGVDEVIESVSEGSE